MSRSGLVGRLSGVSVAAVMSLVLVGGSAAQSPVADGNAQAAKAAQDWVKNNPAGRTTAPERPVPKDNAHPKVSRAEREKLGLPAPTWVAAHGKVQPAVREALDDQRKRIESREPMIEFQGDRLLGFQGTAYVDVYLRHQAKGKHTSKENQATVKEAQRRILSKLTAAEFSLIFAFQKTSGVVGYMDEAGLAKLVEDPEVVAIGLDDQPRSEDPPLAVEEPRPRGVRNERRGKVEVRVYEALEESTDGYVYVIVGIVGARVPLGPGTFDEAYAAQKAEQRKLQDRVLATLTAEEFRVRIRGVRLAGYTNVAGLAKLANHPDVSGVRLKLKVPIRFPGNIKSRRFP